MPLKMASISSKLGQEAAKNSSGRLARPAVAAASAALPSMKTCACARARFDRLHLTHATITAQPETSSPFDTTENNRI